MNVIAKTPTDSNEFEQQNKNSNEPANFGEDEDGLFLQVPHFINHCWTVGKHFDLAVFIVMRCIEIVLGSQHCACSIEGTARGNISYLKVLKRHSYWHPSNLDEVLAPAYKRAPITQNEIDSILANERKSEEGEEEKKAVTAE